MTAKADKDLCPLTILSRWNLLEPPSENSAGESGGVVLLGDTYGEDNTGERGSD